MGTNQTTAISAFKFGAFAVALALSCTDCVYDDGIHTTSDGGAWSAQSEEYYGLLREADDSRSVFIRYEGLVQTGERNSCEPLIDIESVGVFDCLRWQPLTLYGGPIQKFWGPETMPESYASLPLLKPGDPLPLAEPIILRAYAVSLPEGVQCEIGGSEMQPQSSMFLHVGGVLKGDHFSIDEIAEILDERELSDPEQTLRESEASQYARQCG